MTTVEANIPKAWVPALEDSDYSHLSQKEGDILDRFIAENRLTLLMIVGDAGHVRNHAARPYGISACDCSKLIFARS